MTEIYPFEGFSGKIKQGSLFKGPGKFTYRKRNWLNIATVVIFDWLILALRWGETIGL